MLTHPYEDEIPDRMRADAKSHGLEISSDPADGWYHPSALPIRLTIPPGFTTWPIEDRAAVLLRAWPVKWPASAIHDGGLREDA